MCVREGGDTVANVVGDGEGKGGYLIGTGGGEEDDGGESEALLQRTAAGFDVLDASHRDAGAGDGPDATLEIDFKVTDLVAPVAPANGRNDQNRDDPEDQGKHDGENAQVERDVVGVDDEGDGDRDAQDEDDGALNSFANPPKAECSRIELFAWWPGRVGRHASRVASF
jgi:hypothetical protein